MAHIVAKVIFGVANEIVSSADAFFARRHEGPYRFIQSRSQTYVVALKSDTAEKSEDQLSRDFWVVRFSTFKTISALLGHAGGR